MVERTPRYTMTTESGAIYLLDEKRRPLAVRPAPNAEVRRLGPDEKMGRPRAFMDLWEFDEHPRSSELSAWAVREVLRRWGLL